MLVLISSMLLSFLPQHWRRKWGAAWEVDLARGALVSGVLECVGCFAVLCVRYVFYLDYRMKAVAEVLIAKGAEGAMKSDYVQFGAGFTTLMEYLIHPVSLLLMYFAIEGVVRLAAALVNGEVVGTMPLYLVALGQERLSKAAAERALGPRVVDEIRSGDGKCDLRILSCRPKPEWDHLATISYCDALYEVAGQEEGTPPRPYVYLLRFKPEHKIVRGLHAYKPDEVMKKD